MHDLEISKPISFQWDKFNITKIRLRHGITTEEAEQPFFNDHWLQFDESHSSTEKRYQLLGKNHSERLLFIIFTIRGNKVRVISARQASRKERAAYDKKT